MKNYSDLVSDKDIFIPKKNIIENHDNIISIIIKILKNLTVGGKLFLTKTIDVYVANKLFVLLLTEYKDKYDLQYLYYKPGPIYEISNVFEDLDESRFMVNNPWYFGQGGGVIITRKI